MASMNRYKIYYDERDEKTTQWLGYEGDIREAKTWQDAIYSWKDDNYPTNRILSEDPSPGGREGAIHLLSANAPWVDDPHTAIIVRATLLED